MGSSFLKKKTCFFFLELFGGFVEVYGFWCFGSALLWSESWSRYGLRCLGQKREHLIPGATERRIFFMFFDVFYVCFWRVWIFVTVWGFMHAE